MASAARISSTCRSLGQSRWRQVASAKGTTWVNSTTPATSASLLVFFVLAMQCLPTLAVTRREAGGARWAVLQLAYMTGLAWLVAFAVFQGLHLAGVA